MASKTIVSTDQNDPYELDQSDYTWVFAESHLFNGEDASIHQASTLSNDTVIINGRVYSGADHGVGISFEGSNSRITVGATGSVSGGIGIDAEGDNLLVTNNGIVNALAFAPAIYIAGAGAHVVNNGELNGAGGIEIDSSTGTVENNGSIHAYFAGLQLDAGGATVNLGKGSVITAIGEGIDIASSAGEKTKLTNDGLIAMNGTTAVGATDGDEIVINHGTIRGDIMLGAGGDVFNNLDGKYSGDVFGGTGDDLFIVHTAGTQINELSGEGTDTVRSTVSFSLGTSALMASEIENLTLLGTKDLNATGNDFANSIRGNSGDNVLSGGLQNDLLTGGKGRDTFTFATNFNVDEVSDFRAGIDKIDVSDVVDIAGFKDMLKNHVSETGGAVHITSGADELILDHTTTADLQASDFIF